MSVPSFSDLGKSARDVFRTGYHYGKSLIKLNVRAKSGGNVEMDSDLRLDCDTSKLNGAVETQYKTQEYGCFLQKWSTEGTVALGLNIPQIMVQDVGLQSEISYNPETTVKAVKVGANCNKQHINAACSISSEMNTNINILGSIVTSVKGLLIGYQGGYNTETNKMTKNDVALAFSYQDVGVHFRCTSIPYEHGLSLLYKGHTGIFVAVCECRNGYCNANLYVNADWDAALNGILAKNGDFQQWALGAAARCKIDERSMFRCKFNTDLQLGMSLQQKVDDNVTLTMSFNVDCGNVMRGGHKVGLAIEIEG